MIGVSGDIIFQGASDPCGSQIYSFRYALKIHYEETFDIASAKSNVTLTAFLVSQDNYLAEQYIDGSIKVNGQAIVSGTDVAGNLMCSENYGTYKALKNNNIVWQHTISGIEHATDGSASLTVSLDGVNYDGIRIVQTYGLSYYYGDLENLPAQTIQLTNIKRGLVKIGNGSGFDSYFCKIYSNGAWNQYIPYIHNGSQWIPYYGG